MDILLETMAQEWQGFVRILPRLTVGILVFLGSLLVGKLISRGVVGVLARGNFNPTHRNFFKGLTRWVVALTGLVIALNLVGLKEFAASLVAGSGITAYARIVR
jgi:small-conductance mechanosensitive channel